MTLQDNIQETISLEKQYWKKLGSVLLRWTEEFLSADRKPDWKWKQECKLKKKLHMNYTREIRDDLESVD